jgi:hypothetical protein
VNWEYWWSYSFLQYFVWIVLGAAVIVLLLAGVSAGVVARRSRHHGSDRLTVARLNEMSGKKGGET